jgi:hypothetical protein
MIKGIKPKQVDKIVSKIGIGSFGRGKSNLIDLVAILHLNPVKIQKL